jgi:hypothetical protein
MELAGGNLKMATIVIFEIFCLWVLSIIPCKKTKHHPQAKNMVKTCSF